MEGSLKTVSDRRLLGGLDDLVAKSRQNEADLLAYLAEVDRRELYLEQGLRVTEAINQRSPRIYEVNCLGSPHGENPR